MAGLFQRREPAVDRKAPEPRLNPAEVHLVYTTAAMELVDGILAKFGRGFSPSRTEVCNGLLEVRLRLMQATQDPDPSRPYIPEAVQS